MKNIIFIILGIMFIYSCNNSNNIENGIVKINGTINNTSDDMVIISYAEKLDTTKLNPDGTFSIEINIDNPKYAQVINDGQYLILYLKPTTEINFTSNPDNNFSNVKFSGDNKEMNEYLTLQNKDLAESKFSDINFAYTNSKNLISELDKFSEKFNSNLNSLKNRKDSDFKNMEKQRLYLIEATFLLNNYIMNNRAGTVESELEQKLSSVINEININDLVVSSIPGYMDFAIAYTIYIFDKNENEMQFNNESEYGKAYFDIIDKTFEYESVKDELYYDIIRSFIQSAGIESVKDIYQTYKSFTKNQQRLSILESIFDSHNKLNPGNPSIDFSFPDMNGETHKLSDFKGKYIYIDVWASWCQPCLKEIPKIKALKEKFKSKNIEIIGISVDDNRSQWINMVNSQELGGVQLYAGGWSNELVSFYQITGIPRFILIDREGNIINSNAERPSGNIEDVLNSLEGI